MNKIILISTIFLLSFQIVFGQEVKQSKLLTLGVLNSKAKILPMPVLPNVQPRIAGSISVQVKVDLQKGEVIKAQTVAGHPLLRVSVEKAALKTKFEPILQEFETVYGTGVLVYKVEDFTGKIVENKKPKPIITIIKSGILNGKAKVLPKPLYSEEMQNSCAYGKVEVDVLNYMPTGEILLAKAVSGDEVLRKSAEEAAMKATFSIPMINGDINVYVKGKLVYNFEPSEKCISGQLTDVKKIRLISDLKPKVISMPKPEFPRNGEINVGGTVSVIVTIDEQGNVINAEAVSGHPFLRPFAEKAAMKAKFEPVTLSGKPVKIRFPIVYDFVREESPELVVEKTPKLGIVNGKATFLPKPDYPQKAKDLCVGGKVEVEVLIDETGNVSEAKAISGDELLRNVSVEAAKKAKMGTLTNGKPVKSQGIIVYNFDSPTKCLNVGVVNKKAVSLPKPKVSNVIHPRHLRITKEEIVAVQIVIDMEGKVITARAISGHPMLQSPCKNAARQAKFSPIIATMPPIKIRALLVYKFKPDGTIDTDIARDDKSVIGTPIILVEPPSPFCNCRGLGGSVLVQTKINEQGNVIEAKAISGNPFLKFSSEKAALESKFLPTYTKAKILISYNFESNDGGRTAKIKDVEIKQIEIEK